MVIHLPCIDLKPANVRINHQLIAEAKAAYYGAIAALDSLDMANQKVCLHKRDHRGSCADCGQPQVATLGMSTAFAERLMPPPLLHGSNVSAMTDDKSDGIGIGIGSDGEYTSNGKPW